MRCDRSIRYNMCQLDTINLSVLDKKKLENLREFNEEVTWSRGTFFL